MVVGEENMELHIDSTKLMRFIQPEQWKAYKLSFVNLRTKAINMTQGCDMGK
jgi:hypothetical protein